MLWLSSLKILYPWMHSIHRATLAFLYVTPHQGNPGLPTRHTHQGNPGLLTRHTHQGIPSPPTGHTHQSIPSPSYTSHFLHPSCALDSGAAVLTCILLSMPSLCLQVWPAASFLTANGFLSETSLLTTSRHSHCSVSLTPNAQISWNFGCKILFYLLPPTTYYYFCFPKRPCSLLLRYLYYGPFISSNDFPATSSGSLFFLPVSCRILGSRHWSLWMLLQSALHLLVMHLLHVTDGVCMSC